jgi:hypothetical protein
MMPNDAEQPGPDEEQTASAINQPPPEKAAAE